MAGWSAANRLLNNRLWGGLSTEHGGKPGRASSHPAASRRYRPVFDFIAVVMYPYYKETSYAGEEDRQESAHAAESDREAAAGHGLFRGEPPGRDHRAPADRH